MNSSQHPTGGSNPFRNGAPSFEKALGAFFRPMRKVELPEPPAGRKVYLSADHHLFHTNILKHCPERGRLFRTVEEMNASFLDLHNRTVGRDDVVIFAGDYLWKGRGGNPEYDNSPAGRFREMKSLTGKLNGKKYLVRGNHDKFTDEEYLEAGFAGCGRYGVMSAEGEDVAVIHSPKEVINLWYGFMGTPGYFNEAHLGYSTCLGDIVTIPGRYLCGHVHQMWRRLGPFVNVGLDVWDMRPVLLEDALAAYGEPGGILAKGEEEEESS